MFGELLKKVEDVRKVYDHWNVTKKVIVWDRDKVGHGGVGLRVPKLDPDRIVQLQLEDFETERLGLVLRIGMSLFERNPALGGSIIGRAMVALEVMDSEAATILSALQDPDWVELSYAIEAMKFDRLAALLGGTDMVKKIAVYLNVGINYGGDTEATWGALDVEIGRRSKRET